jgi:predicted ester cyclase
MPDSDVKGIVQRINDAFFGADLKTLDELLSPDFVGYSMPPGWSNSKQGFMELAARWAAGFSDGTWTTGDLIAAEGDRVIAPYSYQGTHTGEIFGLPPTGRPVTLTGIDIYRVVDGQATEWWGELNMADLFVPTEPEVVPQRS